MRSHALAKANPIQGNQGKGREGPVDAAKREDRLKKYQKVNVFKAYIKNYV